MIKLGLPNSIFFYYMGPSAWNSSLSSNQLRSVHWLSFCTWNYTRFQVSNCEEVNHLRVRKTIRVALSENTKLHALCKDKLLIQTGAVFLKYCRAFRNNETNAK